MILAVNGLDYGMIFAGLSLVLAMLVGIFCFLNQRRNQDIKSSLNEILRSSQKMEVSLSIYQDVQKNLRTQQKEMDEKNRKLEDQEKLLKKIKEELSEKEKDLNQKSVMLDEQKHALYKAQSLLKQKNNSLAESISYAQRMQKAILPNTKRIHSFFQDFFAISESKDIVSGDFYWINEADNKVFVAVVDCTGHGIPGGFMAMLGHTLLNEIILQQHILDTDQVLAALHAGIQEALNLSENQMEGMNLSLCRLECLKADQVSVQFSGARAKMYYFHNGSFHELKGDPQRIGSDSSSKKRVFTKHMLDLNPGDTLYFFTDGLTHTHNEQGEKFGHQRLQNCLVKYHELPFQEQKQKLESEIRNFRGEALVRDDLTLVGICLKANLLPRITQGGVVVKAPKHSSGKYFNFFEYYTMINNARVILSYKGPFTDILLAEVSRDIRKKIQDNPKVGKKIFSIFMELAQNVLFYSKEMNHFGNNDRVGTLVILDSGDSYLIMTGNLIYKSAIEFLQEKCEKVNSLDRDSLREYKRNLRNATKSEESRGAGIGIIHAALTSANPLEYEIKEFGNDHAFFLLTVNVEKG